MQSFRVTVITNKYLAGNDHNEPIFNKIYKFICDSAILYPNFIDWYFNKVVPGIYDGSRKIILYHNNDFILGSAIVKDSAEKKICNLRINPLFQRQGYGVRLFEKCFELLNTDKPVATISSLKIKEYVKITKYYGFDLADIKKNYYQNNSSEYIFNGVVSKYRDRKIFTTQSLATCIFAEKWGYRWDTKKGCINQLTS